MRGSLFVSAVCVVACSAERKGSPDASHRADERGASAPDGRDAAQPSKPPPVADADGGGEPPPRTYNHYDINHVLSTGQSDSVANGASPFLTSVQPFGNLSFDVGVMTAGQCDGDGCTQYESPTDFVPLVEGDHFFDYGVETMSSGLANQASVFASAWFAKAGLPAVSHDMLVSLHGRSGNTYWCLRKDSCTYHPGTYLAPFTEALMQVKSAKAIAAAKGKSYVVRAVTAIHGGSDHYDKENELSFIARTDGTGTVANYAEALMEWQRDYETELRAITGQTEEIPLFVSQFGSWTDTVTSTIPVRQLEAHVRAPGKVVVVTPNYPFTHYTDCLHYTNYSQRRLGAYFAKAYQRMIIEGGTFEPLRPLTVTRNGNVLTVTFHVPVPPMVIDTTRVTNPGNYGFTYADSNSSATISSVALAGPDTVTVTLSSAPTGDARKLRYALNAGSDVCPGPTNGARGNLRDSDTTPGYHTDVGGQPYELHNWAVHFEMAVP
jgi:hypothetical protein